MKKIFKFLTLGLATTILASCGGVPKGEYRTKPEKITDHLYEVTYADWNTEKAETVASLLRKKKETYEDMLGYDSFYEAIMDLKDRYTATLSKDGVDLFTKLLEYDLFDDFLESSSWMACTSVRSDNYIGRNFDWSYDDIDEYIVHVEADEEKHRNASIGVAHCFFSTPLQKLIGMEDILPMLTMDGINDKGVAINVNVVISDTECSGDTYGTFEFAPAGEHSTGDLCTGFVVRYILDNAKSASHAVYLLEHANIYSVLGQEFHYMISDANESYVCEFVNNHLVVLKGNGKNAAMSNYHVTHSPHLLDYEIVYPAGTILEPSIYDGFDIDIEHGKLVSNKYYRYPMGVERYERVQKDVGSVKSRDDMLKNMQKVWYKKMYIPGNEHDYWSDANFHSYTDEYGLPAQFTYYDPDTLNEKRMAEFKAMQENYASILRFEEQTGLRVPAELGYTTLCQTVHSSAYDIKAKKLSVNVQEIDKTYSFSL